MDHFVTCWKQVYNFSDSHSTLPEKMFPKVSTQNVEQTLKPDFHSHLSLVASEIFRAGYEINRTEINRTGGKNIFRSVHI